MATSNRKYMNTCVYLSWQTWQLRNSNRLLYLFKIQRHDWKSINNVRRQGVINICCIWQPRRLDWKGDSCIRMWRQIASNRHETVYNCTCMQWSRDIAKLLWQQPEISPGQSRWWATKNLIMTVKIGISCLHADICTIPYLLPVEGSHVQLTTYPDVG